jgi:hypothetical protein
MKPTSQTGVATPKPLMMARTVKKTPMMGRAIRKIPIERLSVCEP